MALSKVSSNESNSTKKSYDILKLFLSSVESLMTHKETAQNSEIEYQKTVLKFNSELQSIS